MHIVKKNVEEIRRYDKTCTIKVKFTIIFTFSIEDVKVGVNLGCFENLPQGLNTIAMKAINTLVLHQLRAL